MQHPQRSFAAAAFLLAAATLAGTARAEPVLVELASTGPVPLVARGDRAVHGRGEDPVDVRKRVEQRAAAIEAAREALLLSLPPGLADRVTGLYRHLPLVRMDLDPAERLLLEASPLVAAVHDDLARHPLTASSLPYLGASGWHGEGQVGAGTSVAVLDTGIRYWNGFFGTCAEPGDEGCRVRVFEGFSTLAFGPGETDPVVVANASSHGTNVGGIVGDVAPGTALLSLCVFAAYETDPSTGSRGGVLANDGDVARALDWVIEHQEEHGIVAANLSLGSSVDPNVTGYCSGRMAGAYPAVFANVRDAGVLPVVATGNDYVKTAVAPPACIPSAVRAGAGYDDPAFGRTCGTGPVVPGAVACFSDSNALVDLVAPGNDIDAGGILGLSGTSMAAPHVAGLVALYAARYGTSPIWTLARMRADAVTVEEIGPRQVYRHRSARIGDAEAELAFDSGAVLESSFSGVTIPDGNPAGLAVGAEVVCESELCVSDRVGAVYVDLNLEHPGTGDLVLELEGPDGTVARHEVEGDDELGLEHVNSILGSQHLAGAFDALRGGPIEGFWTLRIFDDEVGRSGRLYRAVLLVDSARVRLDATLEAPEIARPDEPFAVSATIDNRGNLPIDAAELRLELVDEATGLVVEELELEDLPLEPGSSSVHRVELSAPQGSYLVRLVAVELEPDLPPGLRAEPVPVDVTYRTFASFEVDPLSPQPGQPAELTVLSRGMVERYLWDFGDGTGSREAAPAHAWLEPGEYEVTLTVVGPDGTSTTGRTVVVGGSGARFDVRGGGLSCAAVPSRGRASRTAWLLVVAGLLAVALGRRRRGSVVVLPLVAGALAAGSAACGPGGGPGPDPTPLEPWVSLLDPGDPSGGDVPVWVMLSSEAPTTCDLSVEQRVGDGPFGPATVSDPTALRGLDATDQGVEHGLVWASARDVPGDEPEVQLRVTADCGEQGATLAVTSSPFTLLNFFLSYPAAIVITEVSVADDNVPAPVQTDYVELHNRTDAPISLDDFVLVVARGGGGHAEHSLTGQEIAAGGYLVIGELGTEVPGAVELEEELPWTVNTAGAVALVASFGRGVDFVRWGGSPVLPPGDLSWVDDPPLSIPQTLTVLARLDEEADADRASDFCIGRPSPGRAGEGCITRHAPSDLLITELVSQGPVDQVELLNDSDEPVDIGGWVLLWDGGELGEGTVPLGTHVLEPGRRLVLRDNGNAGQVDHGIMDLGENLNIDGLIPIAIGLQDPHGTIVDFLAAGGSRVRWVEWHEDEPTPMPGPLTSLSRRPGNPDTDSADDFCLTTKNLGRAPEECLEPLGIRLVITEVMPGRPDWVEIWNPGPDPVELYNVYLSYTSPYYGGSVNDYRLRGTLEPGAFLVITERRLADVEDQLVLESTNIAIAPDGAATVTIRDRHGFGIDFVMWGEPAGTPIWPDRWLGLGADTHEDDNQISIQRYPHDAPDTDGRDDWCWARPSPATPNLPCE